MITNLDAKLDILRKEKKPLQLTQGLGEYEDWDSSDEEEEVEEKEDDKGKALVVGMPSWKKAQRS